jgi:hypothetical protein
VSEGPCRKLASASHGNVTLARAGRTLPAFLLLSALLWPVAVGGQETALVLDALQVRWQAQNASGVLAHEIPWAWLPVAVTEKPRHKAGAGGAPAAARAVRAAQEVAARGGTTMTFDPAPPTELPPLVLAPASAATQGTQARSSAKPAARPVSRPPAPVAVAAAARPDEMQSAEPPRPLALHPQAEKPEEAGSPPVPRVEERPRTIYGGRGRDPFRSLLVEDDSDLPLLDVNGAVLVGVAASEGRMLAMIEDRKGRSFALWPGDRIRSGRLASVNAERAVFDIWAYGRTERRVLELSRAKEDDK